LGLNDKTVITPETSPLFLWKRILQNRKRGSFSNHRNLVEKLTSYLQL
jgi:hypothetical protein